MKVRVIHATNTHATAGDGSSSIMIFNAVLQINVFQLTGNYKVKIEACESCRSFKIRSGA